MDKCGIFAGHIEINSSAGAGCFRHRNPQRKGVLHNRRNSWISQGRAEFKAETIQVLCLRGCEALLRDAEGIRKDSSET